MARQREGGRDGPRRQIKKEEAETRAEKERLKALFDNGDTTFTTLGVIDVNVMPKGRKKGRKKGKTGKKGEEEGEEEKVTRAAGRENDDPSQTSEPRKRRRGGEPASVTVETETSRRADESASGRHHAATLSAADSSVTMSSAYSEVARAIVFR